MMLVFWPRLSTDTNCLQEELQAKRAFERPKRLRCFAKPCKKDRKGDKCELRTKRDTQGQTVALKLAKVTKNGPKKCCSGIWDVKRACVKFETVY